MPLCCFTFPWSFHKLCIDSGKFLLVIFHRNISSWICSLLWLVFTLTLLRWLWVVKPLAWEETTEWATQSPQELYLFLKLQTLVQPREEKSGAPLTELNPYFAFRPNQKYSFYTNPCMCHFELKGPFLVGIICQSHRWKSKIPLVDKTYYVLTSV